MGTFLGVLLSYGFVGPLGSLLELRANDAEAAFTLLDRAARLAPRDAAIQGALGRALTRRADRGWGDEDVMYARAREALSRAIALEPGNVSTLVTLAEVEMGSGENPARAVELVQRALASAPGREEYRLMLGQALAVAGDYGAAAGQFRALAARASRPDIRLAAERALLRVAEAEREASRAR